MRPTIGCLVNTFLRRSEWFVYDQVVEVKNFNVEVLTREYVNKEFFPYDKVNAISEGFQGIKKIYCKWSYTILRSSGYFLNIAKRKGIKLIHAHFGPNGVYGIKLKEKLKIPLIVSFYGRDITELPKFCLYPPAWLNYFLYFNDLKIKADLFIGNCNFLCEKLREKGIKNNKIKLLYPGIRINKFDKKKNNEIKEKKLLFVGRFVEKKGVEYIIKAVNILKKRYPDIILYLCGDGELRSRLESLVNSLSLNHNIIFLGWKGREEITKLMMETKIFVLPSITASNGDMEGLPTVILEAMAQGLPVVSTFHAGIPEAVINGETGFLVPEKDEKSLAEKIDILLSDMALAKKMGLRGRELLEEKFNLSKQVEKLEQIYKEFIR
ncbi:MAG: glycosyltransferase [Endomicrobia bacterium]|nr:glycosyltransferase [Endomicrobiia bacterium]